jgi:hypothetical protein
MNGQTDMTIVTESTIKSVTKVRRKKPKIGRPTIRGNGVAFTGAERVRRHRLRLKQQRQRFNGNFNWFTPPDIVAAVRKVFGGRIDCDPASHDIAQTVVKEIIYYTIADNGLMKEWWGNILLNPPYNRHLIALWVDKLLQEIATGRVKQAILICQPKTETKWFACAAKASAAICFPSKRIRFWSPDGKIGNQPMSGNAILYFERNVKRFRDVFSDFGMVR